MPTLEESTLSFRSNLAEDELREYTQWAAQPMIDDYLGISQTTAVLADAIDINTADIAALDLRVTQNELDIDSLGLRVTQNETDIAAINVTLSAHIAQTDAHGATGDIVGNLDYCTELVGGVVLLMDLVADAIASTAEVTLADVGLAPAAYDQGYQDDQTNLINDVKSKHNQMLSDLNDAIVQLNDMIAKSKTANQMNTV